MRDSHLPKDRYMTACCPQSGGVEQRGLDPPSVLYNPDAELYISHKFIHIMILFNGCLHKQGHWPTSGRGKNVSCFHTVLNDVNLKSYVFLRNLSFSESRQYDLLDQHVSF